MSNTEGSSPKPRSMALLPLGGLLRSSKKTPKHQTHAKPLHSGTDGSPSLEFSLSERPQSTSFSAMKPPGCFVRVNRAGGSLSETQAMEQLVRRVGSFLQNNPHIHATESKSSSSPSWKCETLWLRFRVLVVDSTTIQVQRRFGCCYKLREIQRSLWEHCTTASTSTASSRTLRSRPPVGCAALQQLDSCELAQEVDRMVELLQSPRVDQQLLALEAVADCSLLRMQPRLLLTMQDLCHLSTVDPKVARVAHCILEETTATAEGE